MSHYSNTLLFLLFIKDNKNLNLFILHQLKYMLQLMKDLPHWRRLRHIMWSYYGEKLEYLVKTHLSDLETTKKHHMCWCWDSNLGCCCEMPEHEPLGQLDSLRQGLRYINLGLSKSFSWWSRTYIVWRLSWFVCKSCLHTLALSYLLVYSRYCVHVRYALSDDINSDLDTDHRSPWASGHGISQTYLVLLLFSYPVCRYSSVCHIFKVQEHMSWWCWVLVLMFESIVSFWSLSLKKTTTE